MDRERDPGLREVIFLALFLALIAPSHGPIPDPSPGQGERACGPDVASWPDPEPFPNHTQGPQRVTDEITPATRAQVALALLRAGAPSRALPVLLAVSALETGHWQSMRRYNLGNFKSTKGDGRDHYALHGKTDYLFRAYKDLDEGAEDFVRGFRTRYRGAWPAILAQDPVRASRAMHRARYYTLSEERYTGLLVPLAR